MLNGNTRPGVEPIGEAPGLDAIAGNAALALGQPREALEALLLRNAAAQSALTAALVSTQTDSPVSVAQADVLLTAGQVAARLSFKIGHVYELARSGKLKSHGLGKYRRFSEAHIAEYLAAASDGPARPVPAVRVRRVK